MNTMLPANQSVAVTLLERNVWRCVLLLIGLMLIIWQLPGTIGLRNISLALIVVSAFFLAWKMRNQTAIKTPKSALWVLFLLTGWMVIVILVWATDPDLSWREFKGQWLPSLGVGISGGVLAAYASRSQQRISQLVQTIFLVLFFQVVLHDVMGAIYLLLSGSQPFRQAPVLYLPEMFQNALNGVSFVKGFSGQYPDKFSYVNNLVAVFLMAEIAQRALLRKRWLPYGNTFIVFAVGAVLLCSYWLMMRNGNVGLLFLFMLTCCMVLVRYLLSPAAQKLKAISCAIIVLLMLVGVSWAMFKSDPRWNNLTESVQIAWDTQSSQAWITRLEMDYPRLSNGEIVETSAYERTAWFKEGVCLAIDNPWGSGFSRYAYGDGIDRKYMLQGLNRGGHSHSGLVDFGIANGIPGLLLWLAFLGTLFAAGWFAFMRGRIAPALTIMFIVSGFFSRSIVDSNLRDHMLQQFMFLASIFYVIAANHRFQSEEKW